LHTSQPIKNKTFSHRKIQQKGARFGLSHRIILSEEAGGGQSEERAEKGSLFTGMAMSNCVTVINE